MAMTPLLEVARASRAALAAAAALSTCVLVTACGSAASSTPASSNSVGIASTAKVSLDVTFAATPSSPAVHYTLSCEPTGGTTPDPAAACAKLLTGANIFAPRPLHVMCPMILQSDARATVAGTYLGRAVHVTIVNGGCDLSRWAKLKAVFG